MYRWFQSYSEEKLMEFAVVPVKRMDPYIGEYLTANLEITLSNNMSFVLEPISGVTSEYDGKLEFYMRGNMHEKVSILRKINENDIEWIIAESQHHQDHHVLNKLNLEKIIDRWLS